MVNSSIYRGSGLTEALGVTRTVDPSEEMVAGQSGQIARMAVNHWSSMARNRRGRLYSIHPSWLANPNSPKIGIDSGPFALKQR